jgi:hypothetical protein
MMQEIEMNSINVMESISQEQSAVVTKTQQNATPRTGAEASSTALSAKDQEEEEEDTQMTEFGVTAKNYARFTKQGTDFLIFSILAPFQTKAKSY